MDNKLEMQSEYILKVGDSPLPDVFLLHLAKHFLNEEDRWYLALSCASERFSFLYGRNRKKLMIGWWHFIMPYDWNSFFQRHIVPTTVTLFEAGHCYWPTSNLLCAAVTQMTQLEELSIHGTKVSLMDLPRLFQACGSLMKLSFTLGDPNWDGYEEGKEMKEDLLGLMKLGFGKLTHLKIHVHPEGSVLPKYLHPWPNYDIIDSWPITLLVLSWCSSTCTDLQIEVSYPQQVGTEFVIEAHQHMVLQMIREKSKPKLINWMRSLKRLVVTGRANHSLRYRDPFLSELRDWMFHRLDDELPLDPDVIAKEQEPSCIWIEEIGEKELVWEYEHRNQYQALSSLQQLQPSLMQSLCFWERDNLLQNHSKLNDLEHLGGFNFISSLAYLTKLKYARGSCSADNLQGLNEFCKVHPGLEQLHVDTKAMDPFVLDHPHLMFDATAWSLPHLKVLVYSFNPVNQPANGFFEHLINNCPNLEELHLCGDDSYRPFNPDIFYMLSGLKLDNLKMLTLNKLGNSDGSELKEFVQKCSKLRSLHINPDHTIHPEESSSSDPIIFLHALGKCLPIMAENLRDIRMEWIHEDDLSDYVFIFLKKVRKDCPKLERLVLHQKSNNGEAFRNELLSPTEQADFIVQFASEMENLVVLGLVNMGLRHAAIQEVNRRIAEEIHPSKPSFWFYLGDRLPDKNGPNFPMIHCDQIVYPTDWFAVPPKF